MKWRVSPCLVLRSEITSFDQFVSDANDLFVFKLICLLFVDS